MNEIKFTVDSALLQELGERLVGKPHIALAELIKNSYDADATEVEIRFGDDLIEVVDNGHGMDFEEFRDYWMRVGSQHKKTQRYSRGFHRFVTGSKGVGRLAVQFLARTIELQTISERDPTQELEVHVNWDDAVQAGELTEATALYQEIEAGTVFPSGSTSGTLIRLTRLNQNWERDQIVELAKEIWSLQPPFKASSEVRTNDRNTFRAKLESPDEEAVRSFEMQMQAWLRIWEARIIGRLAKTHPDKAICDIDLILEFSDGEQIEKRYPIQECKLHNLDFEIRVFTLQGRQPYGLKVEDMRKYFREFGGVHVYDAGFHLPYYGTESDWLGISRDHARRISYSELLPEELQIYRGLQDLPGNPRLFGIVNVNTGEEYNLAVEEGKAHQSEYLQIQVSRDRLVDNKAFQGLKRAVRWSLDFYATEVQRRRIKDLEKFRDIEPVSEKFERVEDIIRGYKNEIPEEIYDPLVAEIEDAIEASEIDQELAEKRTTFLAPIAMLGMAALAYYHEAKKLRVRLPMIARRLRNIKVGEESVKAQLVEIAGSLDELHDNLFATQQLFASYASEEDRTFELRFRANDLIKRVSTQLGVLLRGIKVNTVQLDDALLMPKATFVEWSAIFQNVLLNAVNALLDTEKPVIAVSARRFGKNVSLVIQDNGIGVDLGNAEVLFEPFQRRLKISSDRKALGVGGSGLGLTIVRMIAANIDCKVGFSEPDEGYSTCFTISWRETDDQASNSDT